MILIISTDNDNHAYCVQDELARIGKKAQILDMAQFPQQMRLTMSYNSSSSASLLRHPGHDELSLEDCKVIWWRRPQLFILDPDIAQRSHQRFAYNECYEAFAGLWQTLDAFWVNPPTRDEVASHKAYQLRIAQEVGLNIPRTLITNDPERAKAFITNQGFDRTIYKSFLATEEEWRETRLLKQEEISIIDAVQYAPVIFQEYIPAQIDLRITVVEDQIFAAAVYSQEVDYKVDYRMEMSRARIEPFDLPEEVKIALHNYMRRLGLVYGAIDMRLTPDDRYVFLEINQAGQWRFIEERTKQPITKAFAEMLATHDK